MSLMAFGRRKLAVTSGVVFALILSDCATQSNPGVPAQNNPSVRTGKKTFRYTGGKQLLTVPAGVTKITITADGASGAVGHRLATAALRSPGNSSHTIA
jgi:hypothetical protein